MSDPAQIVDDEDLRRAVRAALVGVSPPNCAALLLLYFADVTHQDLARRRGISLAALKSRLHQGRAHPRRTLLPAAHTPARGAHSWRALPSWWLRSTDRFG